MRVRGLLVLLVLLAALAPAGRASAAAGCSSTVFNSRLFITTGSGDLLTVRRNTTDDTIECAVGANAYGVAASAGSIVTIDIDLGQGGSTLVVGDSSYPAGDAAMDINASFGIGGELSLNGATAGTSRSVNLTGDFASIGLAGVSYTGVSDIEASTGSNTDAFAVTFPIAANAGLIAGAGGTDTLTITGSGANDSIKTAPATQGPIVTWNGLRSVQYSGMSAVTLDGSDGNDTVVGGPQPETILGGKGRDTLKGGAGGDRLVGGLGVDRCIGNSGHDAFAQCERKTQ